MITQLKAFRAQMTLLLMSAWGASEVFKGRERYIVTMSSGNSQSAKKLPTYCVYVPAKACKDNVPAMMTFHNCRAKASEGLRLVCKDRKCPFRASPVDEERLWPLALLVRLFSAHASNQQTTDPDPHSFCF